MNNLIGIPCMSTKNAIKTMAEKTNPPAMCCGMCAAVMVIFGVIVLEVFTIIALVDDYHEAMVECKKSNLWVLLLVLLITSPGITKMESATRTEDGGINIIMVIIFMMYLIMFDIWIALETTTTCTALEGTKLIVVAKCWIAWISTILGVIVFAAIIVCCVGIVGIVKDATTVAKTEVVEKASKNVESSLA